MPPAWVDPCSFGWKAVSAACSTSDFLISPRRSACRPVHFSRTFDREQPCCITGLLTGCRTPAKCIVKAPSSPSKSRSAAAARILCGGRRLRLVSPASSPQSDSGRTGRAPEGVKLAPSRRALRGQISPRASDSLGQPLPDRSLQCTISDTIGCGHFSVIGGSIVPPILPAQPRATGAGLLHD